MATEGWGAVQASGPGPARRGEAPWLDGRMWAGLPSPEGEAIKGGGKEGGAAGERLGRKGRKGGREKRRKEEMREGGAGGWEGRSARPGPETR